tara:strand:- start:12153 stop:12587 length:435 start_codon:yes stop_codon:yes gene_type:complete
MKKQELKKILKPLIKECIKEVIFEDGVLSGVVSEVVRGFGAQVIQEAPQQTSTAAPVDFSRQHAQIEEETRRNLEEAKRKLENSLGASSYGNIFENVDPIPPGGETPSPTSQAQSPLSGYAANDPGVDISGLMALGGKEWKNMI